MSQSLEINRQTGEIIEISISADQVDLMKRLNNRPVLDIEKSEHLTSDEVMQRLQAMGVIRKVHRDRRRMSLEEILFLLVAVGVAVMVGWGVYLFG